jgi:hypothetical protein
MNCCACKAGSYGCLLLAVDVRLSQQGCRPHQWEGLFNACRGLGGDVKAEKQLVVLLSMPLSTRDAVTVLSLDQYPPLMNLLSRSTHKDMALKVVQTVLKQVGSKAQAQDRNEEPQQLLRTAPAAVFNTEILFSPCRKPNR